MNKKYYTADLHLGHHNIIKFDSRPFKDTEEMQNVMLEKWNNKVDNSDVVYLLGDIVWKNGEEQIKILKKMNGQKHLILGNHDRLNAEIKKCFVTINEYNEIKDGDTTVILSHYPMPVFKNHYREGNVMLYGHVHDTYEYKVVKKMQKLMIESGFLCNIYNVGCMLWDYEPVSLEEILSPKIVKK